jgi:hypothetical protein
MLTLLVMLFSAPALAADVILDCSRFAPLDNDQRRALREYVEGLPPGKHPTCKPSLEQLIRAESNAVQRLTDERNTLANKLAACIDDECAQALGKEIETIDADIEKPKARIAQLERDYAVFLTKKEEKSSGERQPF